MTLLRGELSMQRSTRVSLSLHPARSSYQFLDPVVGSCRAGALCAESREFQPCRPVVPNNPNSVLLFCRAQTVLSPFACLPSCYAPAWCLDRQTSVVPSPGWSPAAVSVGAESQHFHSLRSVVTFPFLKLLHVNSILQSSGAPQSTAGVLRAQDG